VTDLGLDGVEVRLVDSFDEAMAFKEWLGGEPSQKGKVAWDVESTGLSPEGDVVRLCSFGSGKKGWALPIDWPLSWGALAGEVLSNWEGELVGHNSSFDHSMTKSTFGVELDRRKVHDTRLMAHVLDSQKSLALKKLAVEHVDPRADVGQKELEEAIGRKGGWTWSTIPWNYDRYWGYGALDTVLTDQLDDVLRPRVMADAPRSYELELAVGWVVEKMERKGVRIDRPYTEKMAGEFEQYVEDVERWCKDTFGVSPGSNDRVADVLLRDGVELTEMTASGKSYTLAKDVLKDIDHPLAQAVMGRRGVQKMLGYLRAYLNFADANDLIHPSINSVGGTDKNPFESGGGKGVRTGRMSMSDPNLQNVPTRTKAGKRIRQCFIPREGGVWLKADLDQIEMRILAHLCQDPGMIDAFRVAAAGGSDFFVEMAKVLFNDPNFVKSDPRRQFVKNSGYALIYGAGIEQFAKTAGATTAEAQAFLDLFDQTFPGAKRFIRKIEAEGRRHYHDEGLPYVRSFLTNRRHVADVWRLYTLVNYLIQGAAGEIMKYLLVLLDQAGLDEYMLFPVHDEVDLDVPLHELSDVQATVFDIMNNDTLLSVPITSSVELGPNWGETKEVAA
jgi:DNA polymerase I-like protein with 3'-5' exonuclease and polymerase domains